MTLLIIDDNEQDKNIILYIHNKVRDNYNEIMNINNIKDIINVNTNTVSKKIKSSDSQISDKEIKCRTLTFLIYFLSKINNEST